MRRHWKLILGAVVGTLLALGAVSIMRFSELPAPMPEALAALASDERVTVETAPWLTFTPVAGASTGLIFYPGGRVPPEAYAPPARAMAEAGYVVVVPSMPFGLAVLDANAASAIIDAHPEVERWVVGGHSLGGAMAAQYAGGNEAVDGLVLWAAYPPGSTDLSEAGIAATSISGSEDGLTTADQIEASRTQLPADTAFIEIAGGNHAGFGWYGEQEGDGLASISREEQQRQSVAATLTLLESLAES